MRVFRGRTYSDPRTGKGGLQGYFKAEPSVWDWSSFVTWMQADHGVKSKRDLPIFVGDMSPANGDRFDTLSYDSASEVHAIAIECDEMTPQQLAYAMDVLDLQDYSFLAHTTSNSSVESPRLRIYLELGQALKLDDLGKSLYYGTVQKLQEDLRLKLDIVGSMKPVQIMYAPVGGQPDRRFWHGGSSYVDLVPGTVPSHETRYVEPDEGYSEEFRAAGTYWWMNDLLPALKSQIDEIRDKGSERYPDLFEAMIDAVRAAGGGWNNINVTDVEGHFQEFWPEDDDRLHKIYRDCVNSLGRRGPTGPDDVPEFQFSPVEIPEDAVLPKEPSFGYLIKARQVMEELREESEKGLDERFFDTYVKGLPDYQVGRVLGYFGLETPERVALFSGVDKILSEAAAGRQLAEEDKSFRQKRWNQFIADKSGPVSDERMALEVIRLGPILRLTSLGWYIFNGSCYEPHESVRGDVCKALKKSIAELDVQIEKAQRLGDEGLIHIIGAIREEFLEGAYDQPRTKRVASRLEDKLWVRDLPTEDPETIHTPSGVVNLKDGTVSPTDPAKAGTSVTSVSWVPGARSRLDKVLADIYPQEFIRNYVKECMGQAVHGYYGRKLTWLVGGGANGKTTLPELMVGTLGDYAGSISANVFSTGSDGDQVRTGLIGKRFGFIDEKSDKMFNDLTLKQVVNTPKLMVRILYKGTMSVDAQYTLWCATNHAPEGNDRGDGTRRRQQVIPHETKFVAKAPTPKTNERLMDVDLREVLIHQPYLQEACLDLMIYEAGLMLRDGRHSPKDSVDMERVTEEVLDDADHFTEFLNEHIVTVPGQNVDVDVKKLHGIYQDFMLQSAYGKPVSARRFRRDIEDRLKIKLRFPGPLGAQRWVIPGFTIRTEFSN